MHDRRYALLFAARLARIAGEHLRRYFGREVALRIKSDGTEVTDADLEAEEIIRTSIGREFPSHGILGEEFGLIRGESRYRWIIDPLDGTRWFRLGVPIFGTLIAFIEDEEPTIGVMHFPVAQETVYAGKGLGCWYRGRLAGPIQIRVTRVAGLDQAIASASGIHGSTLRKGAGGETYNLPEVMRRVHQFHFCGDCLQYALLCRGKLHLAIDTAMEPWDIAALVPCIEEAGGAVAGLNGERRAILQAGNLIAASDAHLLREGLSLLTHGST